MTLPQTAGTHTVTPPDSGNLLFRSLLLKLGDISKETVQKKFWSMKKNKTKQNTIQLIKTVINRTLWEC